MQEPDIGLIYKGVKVTTMAQADSKRKSSGSASKSSSSSSGSSSGSSSQSKALKRLNEDLQGGSVSHRQALGELLSVLSGGEVERHKQEDANAKDRSREQFRAEGGKAPESE